MEKRLKKITGAREFGIFLVFLAIIVIMSIASPVFLTQVNLVNVIRQAVEIGIMSIGMGFIIINGDMDLSIGSSFAVVAMLAGSLFKAEILPPTVVFIIALLTGALLGGINGLLVTRAGIPSFVVTLGTMKIYRSIAYAISGGTSISVFPESATSSWVWGFGAKINGFPVQIFVMLGLYILAYIVLKKSSYGYKLYATGGNQRAAFLSGINTKNVKLTAFVIMGVCSAIAAIISLTYLNSVTTTAGVGREMDAIAASVLGGCALSGGRGTVIGIFIGVLIMGIVKNGMVLLQVPVFWQDGFIGLVVILAVFFDTVINAREKK
jgi:ribose/xylose/arabinose/galactoside ABC-type transport system permease subunit